MPQPSTRNLRFRRYRLTRAIERLQGALAEIEAQLAAHGVPLVRYGVSPRRPIPGLIFGEAAGLCLSILRAAERPLRLTEIVAELARCRGIDPSNADLMWRLTERVRGALGACNRRGITRLATRSKKAALWEIAVRDSER